MSEQETKTDSQWVKEQRLEADRRKWLWARLKALVGWIAGVLTFLWAGIDAVQKAAEWVTKK